MRTDESGDGERAHRAHAARRHALRVPLVVALAWLILLPTQLTAPGAAAAEPGARAFGVEAGPVQATELSGPEAEPGAPDAQDPIQETEPEGDDGTASPVEPQPGTDTGEDQGSAEWDPDAVYGTGTHYGADGGVASYSPGPELTPDDVALRVPNAVTNAAGRGSVIGDDYPARYRDLPFPYVDGISIWDEWNFAYRQCTSFVAWRLRSANGVPFSNQYGGLWAWGDAWQWAGSASSLGIRVDSTPEVGAVAVQGQYYGGAGAYGHVAWVAQVLSDGNIVVEEYNYRYPGGLYGTRVVAPSAFSSYVHIKDLMQPFAQTAKPRIVGSPMVGGMLTAASDAWKPAVSSYAYQWLRNGAAISGATAASYQPTSADLGATLSVRMTGSLAGYTSATTTSDATTAVTPTDANGDGVTDSMQGAPWNTDVNGDGLPDSVGFANGGVQVALATPTGMGASSQWLADFGVNQGWTSANQQRAVIDMNGDGKADIIGFGDTGVYVALSTGSGFSKAQRWLAGFDAQSGWDSSVYQRTLADVNGDGLPDIVGFGHNSTFVALNTGSGFAALKAWYPGFSYSSGWRVDQDLRLLVDVNGDGKADIVAFKGAGVRVALSTGNGFSTAEVWKQDFGGDQGWKVERHQRMLADMNGDGKPDVVGFFEDGVHVALNTGSSFGAVNQRAPLWLANYGYAQGWRVGEHPRTLADVNGDGLADVVGFGNGGAVVALSNGSGLTAAQIWSGDFSAQSWRAAATPRAVTDVNGDGKADLVGYADDGMRVALSTGSAFGATKLVSGSFGASQGWRVTTHPRAIGILSLTKRPKPAVIGQAQVGTQVSGSSGAWAPGPVTLSYQWLRDGQPILNATQQDYVPDAADLNAMLSLRVTASKLNYASLSSQSDPVRVDPGTLEPHTPIISGGTAAGATLTALVTAWGPAPVPLKYQWYRNGVKIPGATGASFVTTASDVARRISVTVVGEKPGYVTQTRTSAQIRLLGTMSAPPKRSPFVDVPVTHKFYTEIAWLNSVGVARGTETQHGTVYSPDAPVNRGAMAAFLFRIGGSDDYRAPTVSPFIDVPTDHRFYREIAWLHDAGIGQGTQTSAGTAFFPESPVNRGAAAAFIMRMEGVTDYAPPSVPPFTDVPVGHKFYREIAWLNSTGIGRGYAVPGGMAYSPDAPVNRGAMAAFMYRMETRPAS